MSNDHKKSVSYESFFGLRRKPFGLTPDPRFFYYSKKHREALAQLVYGVKERKGFIVLSGDLGTGKTTIIKALLERLGENFQVSYLLSPKLKITGFLRFVCNDFGLKIEGSSKIDYLMKLHDFLLDSHEKDKITTLIVDEAQTLDSSMFEEIRMLTNLETSHQKLLQIILVGQVELDDLLDQGDLWQLKQRISTRYQLLPLDCQETKEYIQTRISVAGGRNLNIFEADAIQEIHKNSGGVPSLINMICNRCLAVAYGRRSRFVDRETVQKSAAHLKIDRVTKLPEDRGQKGRFLFAGRSFSYASVVLVLILLAFVISGVGYFFGSRLRFSEDQPPLSPLSQDKQIAVVDLEPDQKVRTTEETKEAGHSENSKTGLAEESGISEVALTPDAEEEAAEITKLSVSSTLGDSEDVEFRTVTVEEGDSIETIILREFGRVDEQLMDAVGEVNPEIEDLSKISAGQIIRLPDETVLALSTWTKVGGKEEEAIIWKAGREGKKDMPSLEGKEVPEPVFQETGQPARMEMDTGSAKSFRTEEEILIELGEIKEPAKEPEGEELFRETSVSALRKSSKREALEPLPADTPQEPLGGYEKPPSEPAVAVSGTVEGAPEKDLKDVRESPKKPRVAVESGKAAEKRPADTETESLVASADAETLEPSRETPRQDLQSVLPEKRREEFEGRLAATEEEVNRFFVSYVERYNRKDLEGFLELFSPRVVQNGTDNLHKIRKIYTDFFGQSELLNYHLEDTRIQIYQNAVKASANYRVEQIPRKGKKRRVWAGDVSWILVREDDTLKIVSLDYRHMTSPK